MEPTDQLDAPNRRVPEGRVRRCANRKSVLTESVAYHAYFPSFTPVPAADVEMEDAGSRASTSSGFDRLSSAAPRQNAGSPYPRERPELVRWILTLCKLIDEA
jgi:hypothetical protein